MQKNGRKKLPLFDIDGTLLKGGNALHHKAFTIAFQEVFQIAPVTETIEVAGMLDRQIIIELLKLYNYPCSNIEDKLNRMFAIMGDYFIENSSDMRDSLLPFAPDVLRELQQLNIPAGLLTGNVEAIAWEKMRCTGLISYLCPFGGFGDAPVDYRKDLIPIAVERANQTTGGCYTDSDVVIIGDTPKDIECAQERGAVVAAVCTGKHKKDELMKMKPDLLLDSFEQRDELIKFICSI